MPEEHPLLVAVRPLVERLRAELVAVSEIRDDDVPLVWEGTTVGGVRLAQLGEQSGDPGGDLGSLIDDVAREVGAPLSGLDRAGKQHAVRLLEERGALSYRKSAETIAEALGVSRFTVYNYLNRGR